MDIGAVRDPHQADLEAIATGLGLFASAVKSGERWTERCEQVQKEAIAAMRRLQGLCPDCRQPMTGEHKEGCSWLNTKRRSGLEPVRGREEALRRSGGGAHMSKRCPICRGSGIITLPVYRNAVFTVEHMADPIAATVDRKTYPCPECSDTAPIDRVSVMQAHTTVDSHIRDVDFQRYAHEAAAHMLVAELLKGGLVRLTRGPDDQPEMRYTLYASIGVIAPAKIASLEERIAERQVEMAREVLEEATRQMMIWGSAYGAPSVPKDVIRSDLTRAIDTVLARRMRTPA